MKKIFSFFKLLFTAFFFVLLINQSSYALTVGPTKVEVVTDPDIEKSFSIMVQNEGRVKNLIKCSIWDITFKKNNDMEFLPGGSLPNSIAKYIKPVEPEFVLEPGELKNAFFTIKVPKGVDGGNQVMAFFQTFPPEQKAKTQVIYSIRLGSKILQETTGTAIIKSRIKNIKVNPPHKKVPLSVEVEVMNEGNTHLIGNINVAITSEDYSKFITSFEKKGELVFPQKSSVIKVEMVGEIPKGSYHALITYEYRDKNIVIDRPFEID